MTSLNIPEILEEITVFLRNQDILTIANRGVSTTTDSGTWASDSTHLINVSNIKNIRSITVDASPLAFGTDYTVDYYFDDSGTRKTQVTLVAAQTGDFIITYDFGTDKIWPDFPRDDLGIDSYPRIAIDVAAIDSELFGYGAKKVAVVSSVLLSTVVYDQDTNNILTLLTSIRNAIQANQSSFFYLKIITFNSLGPLVEDPEKSQEIMHRNADFVSSLNIEKS